MKHKQERGIISALPQYPCSCGGNAFIQETLNPDMHRIVSIFCQDCDARIPFVRGRTAREARQEAIEAWKAFTRKGAKKHE